MLKDSRLIIKRLEHDGFVLISVRGSHHKFKHPMTGKLVIVTHPRRDIPTGTARSIYRQAGWLDDNS
ncbi:type II toxin-antitoxin system HicA family toxin [Devosia sp. MC532]|uniref:type II toxin-antitoxin system HicA family toxin n=1 Tax=Devosia sp. MC532 TaxID=2799788 RepID=UPI0018F539C0|nr:type II toxin-antitoxin system HicA family toxin [Devosia sp. MC532]MBJ7577384.1 type II toxin-antitoxin system HicA family toxin [Devosia sp. MC532]